MPDKARPDFTIPRSFSPMYSPVGRLIRRRSGDRLRGEALHIFFVTMAVVAWLLADFLAWTLLADRIAVDPRGPVSLAFFAIQFVGPMLGFLVAGIGFRPEIRLRLDERLLTINRGAERIDVPLDDRPAIRLLDAVTYHRGLRLLDSTRPFINRPVESVVVISAGDSNIVLGLAPNDRAALLARLAVDTGMP